MTVRDVRLYLNEHPDIPWRDIGDFRNVLVHEYFGLKIDRVWNVIHKDLPKLKKQIEKLIHESV